MEFYVIHQINNFFFCECSFVHGKLRDGKSTPWDLCLKFKLYLYTFSIIITLITIATFFFYADTHNPHPIHPNKKKTNRLTSKQFVTHLQTHTKKTLQIINH